LWLDFYEISAKVVSNAVMLYVELIRLLRPMNRLFVWMQVVDEWIKQQTMSQWVFYTRHAFGALLKDSGGILLHTAYP